MPQAAPLCSQAEACIAEAERYASRGETANSLPALQKAVLLYAAADAALDAIDDGSELRRRRADACRSYAAALASVQRHAEAAHIYQEATDLYGAMDGPDAKQLAAECARALLENVAAVRAQPRERLHLLVARYERAQQQYALEDGTEAEQAECCTHIARIYQRRDRPADAAKRYREALALYSRCSSTVERELARAECHHRLAALLANHLGQPAEAIPHYKTAISHYQEHEPAHYGFQQSAELCRAALGRAEAMLAQHENGRDREWSRD